DPGSATAGNFQRAALLVVPVVVLGWPWLSLSFRGVLLATASGVLASGLGYTAWYAALKYLPVTRAALVQLSVPLIAAVGGVPFRGEFFTFCFFPAGAVFWVFFFPQIPFRPQKRPAKPEKYPRHMTRRN